MILIFLAIHNYGVLGLDLRVNECVLAVGELQKLVDVETHVPLRNSKIKAAIMPGLARRIKKNSLIGPSHYDCTFSNRDGFGIP